MSGGTLGVYPGRCQSFEECTARYEGGVIRKQGVQFFLSGYRVDGLDIHKPLMHIECGIWCPDFGIFLDRGVPGWHSSPLRWACCFYGTLSP
jgi:hypothetical protein